MEAVLDFLRGTRVRRLPREEGGEDVEGETDEEGGRAGPALGCIFLVSFCLSSVTFSFLCSGEEEKGEPY